VKHLKVKKFLLGQSFKLEVSRERSQNARATSNKQQATSLPQLPGRKNYEKENK